MGLRAAESNDAAAWIVSGVRGFAESVCSLVPRGFDAYARVLHPATGHGPHYRPVTWVEIARSTGRVIHPEVQWPNVAFVTPIDNINQLNEPPVGAPWHSAPEEGSLDETSAIHLVNALRAHTTTPQLCWFAVWEGFGNLRSDARGAANFALPSRSYFLFAGPIEGAAETMTRNDDIYQSAAVWWPQDRSWCVATDVDLESTYVGGSQACIEAILATPQVEALEVKSDHGVQWASDKVNPSPLRLK